MTYDDYKTDPDMYRYDEDESENHLSELAHMADCENDERRIWEDDNEGDERGNAEHPESNS